MLFIDIPLRTRRVLLPQTLFKDSLLLVLNGTLLNSETPFGLSPDDIQVFLQQIDIVFGVTDLFAISQHNHSSRYQLFSVTRPQFELIGLKLPVMTCHLLQGYRASCWSCGLQVDWSIVLLDQ